MTARRLLVAALAIGALLLNVVIEYLLAGIHGPAALVPGLLDYTPTWNHGVSFGLFRQNSDAGRLALVVVLTVVVVFVSFLAWRSANRLQAAAYGLVVGGALGNLADRIQSGGVFDYLFLHLGQLSLFICNFSDVVISAGALLLAADALLSPQVAVADS